MGTTNFNDEFMGDAVQQIWVRWSAVRESSWRLVVISYSLYTWIKFLMELGSKVVGVDLEVENGRLKCECARVTGERDILEEATEYLACASQ